MLAVLPRRRENASHAIAEPGHLGGLDAAVGIPKEPHPFSVFRGREHGIMGGVERNVEEEGTFPVLLDEPHRVPGDQIMNVQAVSPDFPASTCAGLW